MLESWAPDWHSTPEPRLKQGERERGLLYKRSVSESVSIFWLKPGLGITGLFLHCSPFPFVLLAWPGLHPEVHAYAPAKVRLVF